MTEDTQAMTVRIPKPVYEWLRRTAFDRHIPMNQIVITAIEKEKANEDH